MAYEIPHDLIKQLQISLRNAANISSYDPHDPSLPNLPSLDETIADLDPSPPYLRCKHCKGRLLRDLKSFICVFCGREQNTDVPPDPINFKNTIACRWLLESLDLDGSEMVGPIDSKELNRGKSPEQFPLTDLLDLEIKWPESEKKGLADEIPAPSKKSTLNLVGVDLDYYFSEEKKDNTSKVSDEPIPLNKQIDGSESFFGDVQAFGTATTIAKQESGDSSSGWEAKFQSASAATRDNSKSIDPFAASSLETTFGRQKNSRSGAIEDTKNSSSSVTNDWFQQQDDLWSSSNHESIRMPGQVEQTGISTDGRTVGTADFSSSASGDWFQDDQRRGGSKKKPDDKSVSKDDDSADAWDDFTSSTTKPKVDEISEIDFFSSTTSRDSNLRNSSQPNSFAEAFPPDGTVEEKATRPDASDLSRIGEENEKTGENSEGSNSDDVQKMMGKMHDLSFMLDSHLAVPPK